MTYQPPDRDRADLRSTPPPPARDVYAAESTRQSNPDLAPETTARDRSIPSLLKELRDESLTLVRQEVALAKTEMSEKASRAGRNIAAIAVGAAVLYAGLLVLLFGGTMALYFALEAAGLSNFNAGWLSFLLVGGITAIIGYALMQKGISTLKRESPVPEKTVQSLKEDKQWLKNQTT